MSHMFESLEYPLTFDPPVDEEALALSLKGSPFDPLMSNGNQAMPSKGCYNPNMASQYIVPSSTQSSFLSTPFDLPELDFDDHFVEDPTQFSPFDDFTSLDFNQPIVPSLDHQHYADFTLFPGPSSGPSSPSRCPSPEQVLPCPRCPRVFTKRWDLNRHFKRSHEKPFCCAHCGQTFGYRKDLGRHETAVHAKYPPHDGGDAAKGCKEARGAASPKEWKCGVAGCNYETSRKDALKRHGRLRHHIGV